MCKTEIINNGMVPDVDTGVPYIESAWHKHFSEILHRHGVVDLKTCKKLIVDLSYTQRRLKELLE